MATLQSIVEGYYEFRGLKEPDENQALLFLVSEIGELADAIVSQAGGWTRNNPGREREPAAEIGDVQMMLTVLSARMGVDPVGAMLDKMRAKGYEPPEG